MAKDPHDDKKLPNIKMLTNVMIAGKLAISGKVVAKADFKNKSDWQNLCNMTPARCEETDDDVGTPDKPEPSSTLDNTDAKGKGKKKGEMPGL